MNSNLGPRERRIKRGSIPKRPGEGPPSIQLANRHLTVWVLSIVTLIGLFVVNIMGFLDTETGSALGCGREWPLCNNSVVPSSWNLQTIIEFGHRAIVGGVSLLLIAAAIAAWRAYGKRWLEVKIFVTVAVGFVAIEAFLGAMGVLFSDPPLILAVHLGVSLMALNGVFLLTIVIGQIRRTDKAGGGRLRPDPDSAPRGFRKLAWFSFVYTLFALYYGAYVANSGAGGAFQGWPFPTESYAKYGRFFILDVAHRSVALGLLVLCVALFVLAYRGRSVRRDLFTGATAALILVCMQAVSGGILVATKLSIPAFLLHVTIVSGLFATLAYLSVQVLPEPRGRRIDANA
jgi:heme a synthase